MFSVVKHNLFFCLCLGLFIVGCCFLVVILVNVVDLEASGRNSRLASTPEEFMSTSAHCQLDTVTADDPIMSLPCPTLTTGIHNNMTTTAASHDHHGLSHNGSVGSGRRGHDQVGMREKDDDSEMFRQMTVHPETSRLGNQIDDLCLILKRNMLVRNDNLKSSV